MTPLRIAILIIGLVAFAVIGVWEILKYRRQQRKQTLGPAGHEPQQPGFRITPDQDADNDYAEVLARLNQTLEETRRKAGSAVASGSRQPDRPRPAAPRSGPETRDLFAPPAADRNAYQNVTDNQIIKLHITALPARAFHGNDILDAVNEVGFEFGEMNVFHHYGVGDMQGERPLFSLSDMFEPGEFDLQTLDRLQTRGLTLFFCLPGEVDGQVVFELMLNTAQRLAKRLGGEIRGAGHILIDDAQISDIRNRIKQQSHS
jgi:cell division protein ZipA